MSVLVTADLHLNNNPRDQYRHAFMEKTLPAFLKKHDATELYILGDLTDEKDNHSAILVNKIVGHLRQLAQICPIGILLGNHDYVDPDNPFFEFVKHIKNIVWVKQPKAVGKWWFLPHTTNYKHDWKGITFKDCSLIFAHNTFAGANVGLRKIEGIPPETFKNVPVISGDIHVPQTFENITYVGAPYTIDFGDKYEPRVLKIIGESVKSIAVPGVQKRLVEIDCTTGMNLHHEGPFNEGDILKVRVALKEGEYAKWKEIRARVQHWADQHQYMLHMIQPLAPQASSVRKLSKVQNKTDQQVLEQYGKRMQIDERTMKIGLELMRQR